MKLRKLGLVGREEALQYVDNYSKIMYASGIWNRPVETDRNDVVHGINAAGYGVDVDIDEENDILYIRIPSAGDMF